MVVAYEIQCRFCDAASLRARGWDHVIYVNIASTLAAGKLLGLSRTQMQNAVALALNSGIVMRQVRVGQVSMQKGASAAEAVRAALFAVVRAKHGMSGPSEIFEGSCGFMKQVTGPLNFAAFEGLGTNFKLPQTYIKLYPVEYHAQAVVEAALTLREKIENVHDIRRIVIFSYEAAKSIIADPAKRRPKTKESADHSLFYILAVTLLDGEMGFAQYAPLRFQDPLVLELIDKMGDVREVEEFTRAYYQHDFPVRIIVHMKNGKTVRQTVRRPLGHPKNPLTDIELVEKFSSQSKLAPYHMWKELWEEIQRIERQRDVGSLLEKITEKMWH